MGCRGGGALEGKRGRDDRRREGVKGERKEENEGAPNQNHAHCRWKVAGVLLLQRAVLCPPPKKTQAPSLL